MNRISTNMPNDDMQYHLHIRSKLMNDLQNKIAGQTRIKELRDDPVAAAHSSRFKSNLMHMRRYVKNLNTVQSDHRVVEGYLQEAEAIMQRVRELTIQGATGTYSTEQKRMMAIEVDQLLNEMVELASAKSPDGTALFAGDRTQGQPFRVLEGNVPGEAGKMITSVEYIGTANPQQVEISEGSYIDTGFPGNKIFWAEQQQVFASVDAADFVLGTDAAIRIDGEEIRLNAGDSVNAVIAKINDADAAVKAHLDPVLGSLVIETTAPHQLMLEDVGDGTALQELGLVSGNGRPPGNIAADARISGGSTFDMMIRLRDRLLAGDTVQIGSGALKGVDMAMRNLIDQMAKLGAQDARMEQVLKRIEYEIPEVTRKDSLETDLDMAAAITELKMLEYTHRAALQTAARIIRPTLLDFLR
jgi:flagellar hook-associated protein 3 FlgL